MQRYSLYFPRLVLLAEEIYEAEATEMLSFPQLRAIKAPTTLLSQTLQPIEQECLTDNKILR